MNSEKIQQVVFGAIDEINLQLPEDKRIDKSADSSLFGKVGRLDSLGLVNLIVATEEKIEKEFGVQLTLTDQEMMTNENSPFQTVGSLLKHISNLLENT